MLPLKSLPTLAKILLLWYTTIFLSTEFFSYFHSITRTNVFLINIILFGIVAYSIRKRFKKIRLTKAYLLLAIILTLTFIQGVFSAPNTTDAMVYHIPRIMYWIQNQTTQQFYIRNPHDFMPPFSEYILLHLYLLVGSDRFLFLSQWVAYLVSVFLCGEIFGSLGGSQKSKQWVILFCAVIPIALLEATSTQSDMVTNVLILLALYLSLNFVKSVTNAVLLGINLGLGVLTKPNFFLLAIIPAGILLANLIKNHLKGITVLAFALAIALVMQVNYFGQNLNLYGNILGQSLSGSGSTYNNELITPPVIISNILRNTFINIPVPLGSQFLEKILIQIHTLIGLDINDPKTTFADTKFHVSRILYPQEDIVGNPVHLIIIIAGLIFVYKSKISKLYYLLTFSFILFCAILKWQPFNPRLHLPYLMIGSILSFLSLERVNRKIITTALAISIPLAGLLIIFNVSKPFISYFFYDKVSNFAPPLSDVPEAFYIRPRERQYFNARPYWYEPYNNIANLISERENSKIKLDLMDGFEYPIWVLLKEKSANFQIVDNIESSALILSTSKSELNLKGYRTTCFKTPIDYGYACLSEKK